MELQSNPSVESFVRYYTDDYELRFIAIKDALRPTMGIQNRPTKIDASSVEEMAYSHIAGLVLPPMVVRRTESGRYEVGDGNHRAEMCRVLEIAEFPAYVVNVDNATFERIVTRANRTNGRSLSSPQERLALAVQDVQIGVPHDDAASAWGVDREQLASALKERRGRENFAMAGVKGIRINKSQAAVLSNMEPAHIKILGVEIEQATVADLQAAKVAINSSPAAQREQQAHVQALLLPEKRKARKGKPGNQNPFTATKAKRLLTDLETGLKQNAAVATDDAVVDRIYQLWRLCTEKRTRSHNNDAVAS